MLTDNAQPIVLSMKNTCLDYIIIISFIQTCIKHTYIPIVKKKRQKHALKMVNKILNMKNMDFV